MHAKLPNNNESRILEIQIKSSFNALFNNLQTSCTVVPNISMPNQISIMTKIIKPKMNRYP